MNHPDEAPKLSKLPFITGDLLLIATAIGIGLLTPAPIGPIALLAIGLCVIFGAALLVFPFIVDYARRQDALLTERQNQIAALARTTADSAEQIAIATAGLHSLAESSAQNLKSLEKLPLHLQERIDAIAQQLTSAKPAAAPVATPTPAPSSTKANKEDLARLEAASEKIARTLAQLEAAAQSKTDAAESTSKALADLLTRATSQVEALAIAAAAASAVAAESTAQLISERTAAATSAATAATALDALAARVETIQLPPAFTPAASASGEPLVPLITTAEPDLSGDNADGNDGVFTPPAPAEKPDPVAEEIGAPEANSDEEETDEETDDVPLEDEPLTDTEAALDEAPTSEKTDNKDSATDDTETEDSEDAEDAEIEEDETNEDLAEEENALASPAPAVTEKLAPAAEDTEESDDEEKDGTDSSETDSEDSDESRDADKDEADSAETDSAEDEQSDESDSDETDEDEPADSDESGEDDEDTLSPIITAANAAPASVVTAAPDSFEPSEPHADEVPVDEPVAPKPPRARKTKPVDEDLGFDLGLIPDAQEVAETAVTSDGFTRLVATAYIGIGNKLFIRGSGPGLSWDKGVPLQFVSIGKWRWETPDATAPVAAKLYKNDQIECTGLGTLTLKPGHQHDVNAGF